MGRPWGGWKRLVGEGGGHSHEANLRKVDDSGAGESSVFRLVGKTLSGLEKFILEIGCPSIFSRSNHFMYFLSDIDLILDGIAFS